MFLIADAGSTKIAWAIMDRDTVVNRFQTAGYNPNYADANAFIDILHEIPEELPPLDAVCYYGSGCGSEANQEKVSKILATRFPKSKIEVGSDMLGAAKALLGKERGIACILGTGANACLYDGQNIVQNAVSLGYLVGDEGSGSYIGRRLVRAYFYKLMPDNLRGLFKEAFQLDYKEFLDKVYHQPEASKYLASFTRFAGDHQDHPFVQQLVKDSFNDFIEAFLLPFEGCHDLPISFVGSVAYHFQDILKESLEEKGLHLGKVMRSPI